MLRYSLIRLLLICYFSIFDKTNYNIVKKQIFYLFLLTYFLIINNSYSQDTINSENIGKVTKLFRSQEVLPIKLSYSNKDVKRNTNDSTFIKTDLSYKEDDGTWNTLEVDLRARGFFRRRTCYFPPIKIEIKKSVAKETLLKGNKKLKLVLPCLKRDGMNDDLVKEFMAYKLYEIITPYHLKTRMVSVDYTETRGKKTIEHKLKGFLIEDDKKLAKRFNGKVYKGVMHPLGMEATTSVQSAFFQFMIGNTDYSSAYQHNQKLIYVDKKMIPIPYDFDMCGLVDASYAVVSLIQKEEFPITSVKERIYRGFKRDESIFRRIRNEYINNKVQFFETIDSFEDDFDNPKEFLTARKYINKFFVIIESNSEFRNKIISEARTK